jgi:putative transcriptional regulator
MNSLEGRFLIASPDLLDPNFARTVVLMVQHNEQGALGLIVNRPSSKSLAELWREVGEKPCRSEQPVYLGGPVPGPLMAIHGAADLGELDVCEGVYFSARKELLDQLVQRDDVPLKVFVGHAGWAPGQLEKELELGGWLTVPAKSAEAFSPVGSTWQHLLAMHGPTPKSAGVAELLNIRRVPPDPSVN